MDYQIVGIVLGALFFIAGGLFTLYKFINTVRTEREQENEKVLAQAKEYINTRCDALKSELDHQKNMHEGKTAELSKKIEELREEMRRHHTQLVGLLTKMIDRDL